MFYVYELIDPRSGEAFYVGKGKGTRISMHVRNARAGRIDNAEKHKRIVEIHDAGFEVIESIVLAGLSEETALRIERERIAANRQQLTNISGGNCTNAERSRQIAAYWLSRMKPFEVWMAAITPKQLHSVETFFGGARAFYDASVSMLRHEASA